MIDQLRQQIEVVRELREVVAEAKAKRQAEYTQWLALHAEQIDGEKTASDFLVAAEATLRDLTLQVYRETGNKAPAPGVTVKIFQTLDYDLNEAKSWALEHRLALRLDISTFEKVAKAENLPFVKITEEPRAQIAQNLEELERGSSQCQSLVTPKR